MKLTHLAIFALAVAALFIIGAALGLAYGGQ